MAISPEAKNSLDRAPEPASPEELIDFHVRATIKVEESGKPSSDPITEEDRTVSKWVLGRSMEVHGEIGMTHEPDAVEILVIEDLGQVQGIDTQIRKHFRYLPIAGISEYDEELVELYKGRRLFGEEVQRAMEMMPEVTDEELDEERMRVIEHARDFSQRYGGSSATPPIDKANLNEVMSVLDRCNPDTKTEPLVFVSL